MKSKLRTLEGPFTCAELRSGALHLTTGHAAGPEIHVAGTEERAALALRWTSFDSITVEWHGEGVRLTLACAAGDCVVTARSAVIHEPLARLYECLPLAAFDEPARKFWRRVFRLMRIPGGRHLLRLIARRGRAKR
jgi:hypothetical protein